MAVDTTIFFLLVILHCFLFVILSSLEQSSTVEELLSLAIHVGNAALVHLEEGSAVLGITARGQCRDSPHLLDVQVKREMCSRLYIGGASVFSRKKV